MLFLLESGNPMHEFRNWLGSGLGGRDVSKFQELPTFPQLILGISVESSRFCRFWRPKKFPKKKSFQLDFFFQFCSRQVASPLTSSPSSMGLSVSASA